VVAPQFLGTCAFSEGLACANTGAAYGFIDRDGAVVIAPAFKHGGTFSGGLAAIKVDNLYGYIDRTGAMTVQPQFTKAASFVEGLAYVELGTRKGFIDRDGKMLGARVIKHQETPGLGDKIDVAKSKWILDFDGKSLASPPAEKWAVKKDGGAFDQFAGATITPRAVMKAVKG